MRKTIHSKEHAVFIARLKKARVEAGLTQVQASKKLDCTQSYISKIESGELKVDAVDLQKFAKIYGKSIQYFVK